MIDDARVRTQILKNLQVAGTPPMEPWRLEMEEIDFGDVMGVIVKLPRGGGVRRFSVRVRSSVDPARFKSESNIAFDLSQQIKAALMGPEYSATKLGQIVKNDNGSRGSTGA
jgi:hypothetical protein